jgi:hypothetical protein
MILKSFKSYLSLLILLIFCFPVTAEDKIDIWKNNKQNSEIPEPRTQNSIEVKPKQKTIRVETNNDEIKIEDSINDKIDEVKVYGIYDPADYNFNLNMWSSTTADDLKASLNRINKIRLSTTSKEILENVLLSFSYPPLGMSEKEFVKLKVDWLIKNNRSKLIESFLKQNEEFDGKRILVQYLVDENIAKANINEGCKKIKFIDSTIKDAYLEKFKIYCLVFNKKKPQAQLLLDLLREQKQSDKFFDDKINFLLGISEKTSNKINEKNLLNFYLSSITIKDFNYTPSNKTKKEIWKYLNAANLIKIDDVKDKEKIKELEIAANQERLDKKIIFDIYKQIPFNLNTLINAKNLYQTLDTTDARSLIYQKYLLSEDTSSKIEYLFLLEDLFKKDNLQSVFSKKMSDSFETIGLDNIPEKYLETVGRKIISNDKNDLKKVKYNDKILHQSKIIKFYVENEEEKKIQKDIDKIFRKISKNKKYFYSAKDLALVDALIKDGFKIPDNFDKKELSGKYEVPKNLMQLIDKKQNAFLALKIVEIIGEDEPYQLDPETIYFITNLLNEMDLVVIRNKVLISALPQRA